MARKAPSPEFEELAAFLTFFFDNYMTAGEPIPPEVHPLRVLLQTAERAPKRALIGLKMALGDCLELAAHWPPQKVKAADDALRDRDLLTLSELRRRYGL